MHLHVCLAALPLALGVARVPEEGDGINPTERPGDAGLDTYIVKLKPGAEPEDRESILLSLKQDTVKFNSVFMGFGGKLTEGEVQLLREHIDVEYVEKDGQVHGSGNVTQKNAPWGLGNIPHGERKVKEYRYDEPIANGTCVYSLDSGVGDTHQYFGGRARQIKTFVPGQDESDGTHVTSTASSAAEQPQILSINIIDNTNRGSTLSLLQAIEYIMQDQKERNCPKGTLVASSIWAPASQAVNDATAGLVKTSGFIGFVDENPKVSMCVGDGPDQTCTDVEAQAGECVAVPDPYTNSKTSLSPNVFAGTCQSYLLPGCSGSIFSVGKGVKFNHPFGSFRCGTTNTSKTPQAGPHWEWSRETLSEQCIYLDKLSLYFEMGSGWKEGTQDTVKIGFPGASARLYTIKADPDAGFREWQDIDIERIFQAKTVLLSHLDKLSLWNQIGKEHTGYGVDTWKVQSIKFQARCADSGILVEHTQFASIGLTVGANIDMEVLKTGKDERVWEDDMYPSKWVSRPACSHLSRLLVTVRLADEAWAGTNKDVYLEAGNSRILLAHSPSRDETFFVEVDLKDAFGVSDIPLWDKLRLGVLNQDKDDMILLSEFTVQGVCVGPSQIVLENKQKWDDWIETKHSFEIHSNMWESKYD